MISGKHQIFVIQPFDKSAEGIYHLIRSAAAKVDAVVVRADSAVSPRANNINGVRSRKIRL